jgi:hypothetical protein
MGDGPVELLHLPAATIIETFDEQALRRVINACTTTAFSAAAVWPASNRAIYVPFVLSQPMVAKQLFWMNNTPLGSNVDIGIFDVTGARLVSSGSTAQSGTTDLQAVNIADTELNPCVYYLGMSVNNTTGTFFRETTPALVLQSAGVQQQASAFALPSQATFANPAAAYVPRLGIVLVATV